MKCCQATRTPSLTCEKRENVIHKDASWTKICQINCRVYLQNCKIHNKFGLSELKKTFKHKVDTNTIVLYVWQMNLTIFMFKPWLSPNVSATPIGQMGLEMGWFPLCNWVCLIMKKAPSDSPTWQLKKRELLRHSVVTAIIFSNHKTS